MRNARSMIAAALAPLFAAGAWLRRVAAPTRYRATFRGAFLVVEVERAGRAESTAHALRDIQPSSLRIVRRRRRLFAASESSLVVRAAGVDVVLLRGRREPMERAARDVRAWFVRMREAQRSADATAPEVCEQDALACTSPMATCHSPKPMRVLSGDDGAPAASIKIGWSEQTWPESRPRHGERLSVTLPPRASARGSGPRALQGDPGLCAEQSAPGEPRLGLGGAGGRRVGRPRRSRPLARRVERDDGSSGGIVA